LALEIKRKFLVVSDEWRMLIRECRIITDHLIARFEDASGKARIRLCDNVAMLTIKGSRRGYARREFHIPLSHSDAASMIEELGQGAAVMKRRNEVSMDGLVWQIDEYLGKLSGLVTCDVELPSEDYSLSKPGWAGADITANATFSSSTLVALLETGNDHEIKRLLEGAGSVSCLASR
jgi:adenylate cyclase